MVCHTRLCDRVILGEFDAKLIVPNAYFSCQFGCIIGPTGYSMNKHTYNKSTNQYLT